MRFIEKLRNCDACLELAATRTQVVPGEGPIPCPIVFLGEAPGRLEDEKGSPFCGASGQLLRADAYVGGLRAGDYHILNMLKCRPPENRDPTLEELKNCRPFLLHQLKVIKPKVIVCLGKYAQAFALHQPPYKIGVTKNAGRVVNFRWDYGQKKDVVALLTFHPAFVMRNRGNEIEDAFISHFRKAKRYARRL